MLYLYLGQEWRTKIEDKKYKVWISLVQNLGIKKYQKLIQKFGSKSNLFNASKEQLEEIEGIGEKIINNILSKKTKQDLLRHLEYMKSHNIDILSIEDKEYPILLKEIYNPPICIYIIGRKNILNEKNIAIVGCRDASEYGKSVAQHFSYNLSKAGINIVSGLARGIDSFAHIGAIKANGKTIAVLGNGLDMIFPKENTKLAQDILEYNGAIISEYPLGTKPDRSNFPARNRIISGLCDGVLVVEAKPKSRNNDYSRLCIRTGKRCFCNSWKYRLY